MPWINSTLGKTVVFISSYNGCQRLYNHIILSGIGYNNELQFCKIALTRNVFPQDVGPLTLAVKGCLKTK